ncbi:hypothetical protein SAMD00019534_023220 [Acytostelium subglobosum LB1]|uniref:hypothetical protein n=1 Tax=Acytostelium subglobosum LB1 TaxID=1410327 RepID=UPI0006449A6F|nr:hypothetical protein SAMD00019534_023220 [Acytostelium subglobosum LB1]GAM19147.1 hypothetical protein SAMD00019534_023220 [Acytostelium subglobosum LB1]|eukprot:XP_012757074.1 hypothetical protein SAMD00019534_023220 [Acytostelium subglobosum LB1]
MACADVVKSLITEKKCNDMFDKRLQSLWTAVQKQATTYKSLSDTRKLVHDYFKELHELLVVEEHKLVSPVTQQMDEAQVSINNMVDEIGDISELFNLSTQVNNNNQEADNDDHKAEQDVTIIQSCTTVKEYIDKTCTPSTKDMVTCSDYQLLNQLNEGVQRIKCMPECPVIDQVVKVKLQADGLNTIRRQLQLTYTLINADVVAKKTINRKVDGQPKEQPRVEADLVFLYSPSICALFDPRTGVSREFINVNQIAISRKCAVYAKGHIYIFGMSILSTQCVLHRFSIATRQWTTQQVGEIQVAGKETPKACFDGDSTIYLVGSFKNGAVTIGYALLVLNIDTLQPDVVQRKFTSIFDLNRIESLYYYNYYLYALTTNKVTFKRRLWSINCNNRGDTRSMEFDVGVQQNSAAYDGNGKMYFYDQTGIIEYNLGTQDNQIYPHYQLLQLDTMLYFSNINNVLLNGALVRCPDRQVDHDHLSCLVRVPIGL